VTSLTTPRALGLPGRRQAAANALGSVRAEGLDPSSAEPDLAAWTRGEIDAGELVTRGLDTASDRFGQPSRPPAAA